MYERSNYLVLPHPKDNKLLSVYRNIKSEDGFCMQKLTYHELLDKYEVEVSVQDVYSRTINRLVLKDWWQSAGYEQANKAISFAHCLPSNLPPSRTRT